MSVSDIFELARHVGAGVLGGHYEVPGAIGHLELIGKPENAFGNDVADLTLEVEGLGDDRMWLFDKTHLVLRVHVFDTAGQQYQVPEDLRYGEATRGNSNIEFHHRKEPFAFWIVRRGEIIFDTRPEKITAHPDPLKKEDYPIRDTVMPGYPLVFSDQYLQIATAVPDNANIYGLGDGMFTSGFRHNNNHTVQAFWNTDPAGNPTDRNLYGAHPFYLECRKQAHGVYLRNSHGLDALLRTGVVEFRALGGTLDLTFMAGPTPLDVIRQYAKVIGRPAQMPYWSFGFNLCCVHYESLAQTEDVVRRMREAKVPLEVMWNDFWYMDRKRNFTLGGDFKSGFAKFAEELHARHQHYVPILDAGMTVTDPDKDPYEPFVDGDKQGLFLKADSGGGNYEGAVWGGATVWPDWTHKKTPEWWRKWLLKWKESMDWDGLWLDMNEPANLPQATERALNSKGVITINGKQYADLGQNLWDYPPYAVSGRLTALMQIHNGWRTLEGYTVAPSATTADGWRHYHQHNLYPIQETKLTRKVMEELKPNERPFILSRATFPGQGARKFSCGEADVVTAHWLGDNSSTWESLRFTVQGCLQFQLFQIPMVGADVGGFGGNANEELVNRWMSMGAFLPFYRNHNVGTPQEPYLWPSVIEASRKAIDIRYRMLPYWESLFIDANLHGTPPIRPLFFEFRGDELYSVDQQWMVGSAMLISPCLQEGERSVEGVFPKDTTWRDWYTHKVFKGGKLDAPLGHIPLHLRGGSAILLHTESQYTLKETREHPFELLISLHEGKAANTFWLDDGMSIKGPKTKVACNADGLSVHLSVSGEYKIPQQLAKIVVLGVEKAPRGVEVDSEKVKHEYVEDVQELRVHVQRSLKDMTVTWK